MLRALGVAEFDERVYRALLRRPDAASADLAVAVSSTPRRVSAALARLVRFGLVRRDGRYAPNDPEAAIDALVHRRQAELDAARSTAAELAQDYRTGTMRAHPALLVEVVTGQAEIYRRTMEIYQGAAREILAFERPPYAVPADFDEVAAERPVLDRGVTLRVIYEAEALDLPEKLDTVRSLAALGERARTLPVLPLKLLIADGKIARVSLTSDAYATESVAIIHVSGLLDALLALFEAYWQQAHPIAAAGTEPDVLTEDEARVLAMLGAGLTDESIARHLGTSPRTSSRRVTRILELLQAANRFQAGAQAVRRGWL